VSQAVVVTRLAVRELWISFRLLVLLAAHVCVGAIVALLPASATETTLLRLAIGLGAALVVGCAIAADALSTERALGRAGWLVTRSISRATLLLGWFVALASVTLLGLGAGGILGWLAVAAPVPPVEPAAYAAVLAGVAAMALAALAIGLLLGTLLSRLVATVAALVVAGALSGAALTVGQSSFVPLAALADLATLERPIGDGIRGTGIFLAVTGAAMVVARVALGRVDL
jgi:ABC-type transport system involved in multi-copper enzyme maturation permease subunit